MSDPFQRPVDLSLRKKQGDSRKRQKQVCRKPRPDGLDIHSSKVDADEPCKDQRKKADVDSRRTTENYRHYEGY